MHSAADKQQRYTSNEHRLESSSKKHPHRIQIISKIKKNQINVPIDTCSSQQIIPQAISLRRTLTTGFQNAKISERQHLIMIRMREQLEGVRRQYQQRFILKMKQTSIEIGRLNNKLESNRELLAKKDAVIAQLTHKLNSEPRNPTNSPSSMRSMGSSSPHNSRSSLISTEYIQRKMQDIEQKFHTFSQHQKHQENIIKSLNNKIQKVQRQLIVVLGSRISSLKNKFLQSQKQLLDKINLLQQNCDGVVTKFNKKLLSYHEEKAHHEHLLNSFRKQLENLTDRMEKKIKNQIQNSVKDIQSNIKELGRKVETVSQNLTDLQHKKLVMKESDYVQTVNNSSSFCSSKRFLQNASMLSRTPRGQTVSCFFDDYEEVYQQLDSLCQDKFFHPNDSSFHKQSETKKKQILNQKPQIYNYSPFQSSQKTVHEQNYQTAEFNNPKTQQQHQSSSKKTFKSPTKKQLNFKNKHNQSFQQFNSDDNQYDTGDVAENTGKKRTIQTKQLDTSNEIRFIATMKYYKIDFPVQLDVDINGMIKLKGEIKYLVDPNNKFFVFSDYQLRRLKANNYIY